MNTVTLRGTLTCATPQDMLTVLEYLPGHIHLTREEPGCLRFEAEQREDDLLVFDFAEAFVDEAAFEAHQARNHGSAWWSATKHIPRDFTRA